jgi:hypothetical protein
MKKYIIILLTGVLISLVGYSQSADNQNTLPLKHEVTLKQQLLVMKAGQDNPTRLSEIELDQKMIHERDISEVASGPRNDKVGTVMQDDRKPEQLAVISNSKATASQNDLKQSNGTQTMGAQAATKIDYRSSGGGNSQPDGAKSGREINYRSVKGSNEQPVGNKPK